MCLVAELVEAPKTESLMNVSGKIKWQIW